MAAEEINARADSLHDDPPALKELLELDHAGLFRRALERLDASAPLARTALLALALAHGRGLPRQDRIWEEVTSALAPRHEPVTLIDINEVLAAAGAYVMLDHEHGQGQTASSTGCCRSSCWPRPRTWRLSGSTCSARCSRTSAPTGR